MTKPFSSCHHFKCNHSDSSMAIKWLSLFNLIYLFYARTRQLLFRSETLISMCRFCLVCSISKNDTWEMLKKYVRIKNSSHGTGFLRINPIIMIAKSLSTSPILTPLFYSILLLHKTRCGDWRMVCLKLIGFFFSIFIVFYFYSDSYTVIHRLIKICWYLSIIFLDNKPSFLFVSFHFASINNFKS